MTTLLLVATDRAAIQAVRNIVLPDGVELVEYARVGRAAAATRNDNPELVLLDDRALTTAACVGPLWGDRMAAVYASTIANDTYHRAKLADVNHVITLPAEAPWIVERLTAAHAAATR